MTTSSRTAARAGVPFAPRPGHGFEVLVGENEEVDHRIPMHFGGVLHS
jgi:hypothetical protein